MFSKYLVYKRDSNELLLFILKQLVSDQISFLKNRYNGRVEKVEIPEQDLLDKVGFSLQLVT